MTVIDKRCSGPLQRSPHSSSASSPAIPSAPQRQRMEIQRAFEMTERVLRKDQLELSLHNEKKLIKEGALKDDNPLDLSEPFRVLCDACRKGDLKVCQEKISEGVNINARDIFDYTPLILVSLPRCI